MSTAVSLPLAPARISPAQRLRRLIDPPRITGLDVARALAIIGMIGAHVGNIPEFSFNDPLSYLGIVHGNSAILFAVLAGISISLLTGRMRIPEPADLPRLRLALVGRGACIFLIGLGLEMLGTVVAVILTFWGVLYIAALPALRWPVKRLLLVAVGIALLGPVLAEAANLLALQAGGAGSNLVLTGIYRGTTWVPLLLVGMALGRMDLTRTRVAVWIAAAGVAVSTAAHVIITLVVGVLAMVAPVYAQAIVQGTYSLSGSQVYSGSGWSAVVGGGAGTSASDAGGSVSGSASSAGADGLVPASSIDMDGLVCYPPMSHEDLVSCAPPDVFGGSTSSSGSGMGMSGGWADYPASFWEQQPGPMLAHAFFGSSPHSGATMEIFGSGGLALVVIGVMLVLAPLLRWALLPLAAMGSMPLTSYALHVLVILVVGGPMSMIASNGVWAGMVAGLLVLTTAWAALRGRGPLEQLTAWAARRAAAGAGAGSAGPSTLPADSLSGGGPR